ncbi:hypothetical protein [Pedobacter deserti]|uniref:hypothetical protein n=1 Tax=Pedobacter deserti TaxID=2817382 RepID=UPI00210D5222|nr:hypothetical protein [Pedobacter sp. SYSU D00382]
MEKAGRRTFTIEPGISGIQDPITVQYKETTDGLPYYALEINGSEVQLRKDEEKWEQIWGDLNEEHVEKLGQALNEQTSNQP